MPCALFCFVLNVLFSTVYCQKSIFAELITRRCLEPDPVGLLNCVVDKISLPYVASWGSCADTIFGENVRTTADIIIFRCKSIWEGKGVKPGLIGVRDCVREKFGMQGPSAEIAAAYVECEITRNASLQQRLKTSKTYQDILNNLLAGAKNKSLIPAPVLQPPQQATQLQTPTEEIAGPVLNQPEPQLQLQGPVQELQAPLYSPQQSFLMQILLQQTQPAFIPPFQLNQVPFQYAQAPLPNQQ